MGRFIATALIVFGLSQLVRIMWPGQIFYNAGLAFSWQLPSVWVFIISGGFLVLVGWWWYRTRVFGPLWSTWLGLVFGGGASNLFERFMFNGSVADYFQIGLATANLADIAIVIGVLGALWRVKD